MQNRRLQTLQKRFSGNNSYSTMRARVCRGSRGNPNLRRERQPTVARAFSMRLPRAARQSQSAARASAVVSRPSLERQPTVARAFSMRLPRAPRQSQSAARASADRHSSVSRPSLERFPCVCRGPIRTRASADRRSSVFHAFAAGRSVARAWADPQHERQPTVARAFVMRLPRAARQSQSAARASVARAFA